MFNKCCPSPAKSEHIKFVNLLRHKKHVKNITYVASKEQIFLLITCTLHIQIPKFTIIIKVSKKCVTSFSLIIFYNKNNANSFAIFFFFHQKPYQNTKFSLQYFNTRRNRFENCG